MNDPAPSTASITTAAALPDRWNDVVTVFGRRGDDPTWCWCRRFFESAGMDNRRALRAEITSAETPPGVIAYVDDVPAGWTRVMPRDMIPGVTGNAALRRILPPDPGAWWVTCFAVQRRHRNAGVATTLLLAAVEQARQHGATLVQGHPVDTAALSAERVSGSALFTGTMRTFEVAGFVETGRTYRSRPVMTRSLSTGETEG